MFELESEHRSFKFQLVSSGTVACPNTHCCKFLKPTRGHNSEVSWTIGLVIELDLDSMHISIVTKFGEDPIRIVRVRERKP